MPFADDNDLIDGLALNKHFGRSTFQNNLTPMAKLIEVKSSFVFSSRFKILI